MAGYLKDKNNIEIEDCDLWLLLHDDKDEIEKLSTKYDETISKEVYFTIYQLIYLIIFFKILTVQMYRCHQ